MKSSRLFQIVYELMSGGRLTAPELARRLEVSVRTIYRDVEALCQGGEEPAVGEEDGLPEISLLRRDSCVSIHKAIHSLREPYREIFLLRTLSELSFREIGEVFDRTENWARVTYYRARTMLAQRLEE